MSKPALAVDNGTTPEITTESIIMTPGWAAELLEKNESNRPLSAANVKRYAKAMVDGSWALNGEAIILDQYGNLLNGQHRLHACVESEKDFPTMLMRGVDRETAFATMDTGKKRTPADVLAMLGSIDHQATSTAIRNIVKYLKIIHDVPGAKAKPEPSEVATFFTEHPLIEKAAEVSGGVGAKLKQVVAPHVAVAVIYLAMDKGHEEEVLKNFFSQLRDGTGLSSGDPIHTLRERLMRESREKRRSAAFERIIMTIRAFNAHIEGKQLRHMVASRDGAKLPEVIAAGE